jgi:hypothetical protein
MSGEVPIGHGDLILSKQVALEQLRQAGAKVVGNREEAIKI